MYTTLMKLDQQHIFDSFCSLHPFFIKKKVLGFSIGLINLLIGEIYLIAWSILLVSLYQADSNSVMTRYAVNRISFYARGAAGSPVASCFAFTWSHGETKESAVYRCHVFRCHIAEAVNQVSSKWFIWYLYV